MVERPDYIPESETIKIAGSLTELFNTQFNPANCIVWPRRLSGDFNGLARALWKDHVPEQQRQGHWTPFGRFCLTGLEDILPRLEDAGRREALETVIHDMKAVAAAGAAAPTLRVIGWTGYGSSSGVEGFHTDGTCHETYGRVLCCYNDPVTENKIGDELFRFRPGDIWRQAGRGNPQKVKPLSHRAPVPGPDGPPRLLMVTF
jgi:hypothetical protein